MRKKRKLFILLAPSCVPASCARRRLLAKEERVDRRICIVAFSGAASAQHRTQHARLLDEIIILHDALDWRTFHECCVHDRVYERRFSHARRAKQHESRIVNGALLLLLLLLVWW